MKLDFIQVQNFRNIADATVQMHRGTNAFVGANAQGKTNLAEAVYLMACAKSFRTPRYRDLIRHGQTRAEVLIGVEGEGLPFQVKMVLDEKEGKAIYKNGVRLTRLSEFLGLFRVVPFCPEHLSLVKDGPGKRRSFLDGAICQLRPYFASLLNECNRIEAQRAALLKQSSKKKLPKELFEVWNERLAEVSVKVASIRADYVKELTLSAPEHFWRISSQKERLALSYRSDVYREGASPEEMKTGYLKALEEGFEGDVRYGFTQKGIHRDDLVIQVDSFAARSFASQGQQRSAVLALKLAEGEISRKMTGKDPVYLLDDVLSELDESRRSYVTSGLLGKQVIMTGTDRGAFGFADCIHTVEQGVYTR
ncbi:MAG: DNA replication/repair protein RecF [Clostridia bacterium]|nr:DNA replication/repair protein RecF [Clostridia bacterium]